MDEKLKKIIDDNAHHFNEWIEAINEHNATHDVDRKFSEEEHADLVFKVADVLSKISTLHFRYGAFKDRFDNSKMSLNLYGPDLIIISEKTGSEFTLGIDNRGICLETYMKYGEHLRHMDDSFYRDLFTLMELGDFDIQENEFYPDSTTQKYNGLFNNHKSKIFRLIRNYIVGTAENVDNVIPGNFHISWGYERDFYEIIYNSCLAFKILYKLNYSLWKVHESQSGKKQ